MTKVDYYRQVRDDAIARGDLGVARAMSSDLRRWGVPDAATQAPAPTRNRGGRPKLPRCEHNRVADRCEDCRQAEIEEAT